MTTETPVSAFEIEAYIDGALDPVRRMAVEDHLANHPDVAAQVMADLRTNSALRVAFLAREAVSPDMDAAARRVGQRLSRQRWRLPSVLGAGALAASLALAFSIHSPVPDYVGEAVVSHKVALMRASMTPQAAQFDAREMMRATNIYVPALLDGWQIADIQLVPADNGPALQILVRTTQGALYSIYALRTDKSGMTSPMAIAWEENAVAFWRRNGISYALTGPASPGDLDRDAEDLADNRLS